MQLILILVLKLVLCWRRVLALHTYMLNSPYQIWVCFVFVYQKSIKLAGFKTEFRAQNNLLTLCVYCEIQKGNLVIKNCIKSRKRKRWFQLMNFHLQKWCLLSILLNLIKTYTAFKSFLILIFCLDIPATHGLIMPVVYKGSAIQITMYRGKNLTE